LAESPEDILEGMDSYGRRHIFIITQKQIGKNSANCLTKICETDSLPFLLFAGYSRAYAFFIKPPPLERILPLPIYTLPNIQGKGYPLWGADSLVRKKSDHYDPGENLPRR
jgi:hypothetical protein